MQQRLNCWPRGIALRGTRLRNPPPHRCNDGLISYFCKDGGSRLHLECFPEENRRTKCDVFQIVFNGAPKTLDSLAPDWLEESGLRDLNVKH